MLTFTLNDLARILREAAGVADSVDLDADILDTEFEKLGYESIAMLETGSRIEREYHVVIDDEALTTALTPRALINLVNEYLHDHAELPMTGRELHSVEHDITVSAGAADVYQMLANVENWPRIFPPAVYVERLKRGQEEERIRIWAIADAETVNWTQNRRLFPRALRIEFRDDVTALPAAEIRGTWIIEPSGERETMLRVRHEYRPAAGDPAGAARIAQAIDRDCQAELPALKSGVEAAVRTSGLTLSVAGSVVVGSPARDVYEFLGTADGPVRAAESVRVCLPGRVIAFKRTALPALMTSHTGRWELDERPDGTTQASFLHTVVVNPDAVTRVLGPAASVSDASALLKDTVTAESKAILGQAKRHAEDGAK